MRDRWHEVCPPAVTVTPTDERCHYGHDRIDLTSGRTAFALDDQDEVLDQIRITADRRQVGRLLGWAKRWPDRVWTIENVTAWDGCCPASWSSTTKPWLTSSSRITVPRCLHGPDADAAGFPTVDS